jgi:YidC/Oxa1 family membrane protein insertase
MPAAWTWWTEVAVPESMEKRILLSFALSFLVILIFYQFFAPVPPPETVTGDTAAAAEAPVASPSEPSPVAAVAAPGDPGPAPEAIQIANLEATEVRIGRLVGPLYAVSVSNQGGVVESLRLLEYSDAGGEPLELVDPEVGAAVGWPLELATGDSAIDERLRTGLWVLDASEERIRLDLAGGALEAYKELRIGEGYRLEFSAGVRQAGRDVPFALVWQGDFGDQSVVYDPGQVNLVYREANSFERLNVSDFAEPPPLPASEWSGLEDRYFVVLLHSPSPEVPVVRGRSLPGADEDAPAIPRLEVPYTGAFQIYAGPKQRDRLRAVDPALVSVIHYGFFQILSEPLLTLLLWIHGYIGNFGWSIILMTLLINILLFPLRLKQQLSMLGMQKIQPQLKRLQEKYKQLKPTDPRRAEVQSEMMGLYQKHGVNPLGGCLPMLLQMPILYAIFQLLRMAIEVRQAPWLLWIQDLSAPDPLYILPAMMGLSMVASQKMMPTTMDPSQKRMMMFLPLMFVVFMVRAQSGLVLYWFTSQMFGVGQQILINRYWAPRGGTKELPPDSGSDAGKDAGKEARGPKASADDEAGGAEGPGQRRRRRRKR